MKISSVAFMPLSVAALIAVSATPSAAQTAGGDIGMQIANQGTSNGGTACVTCHGAHGEGNAVGNFPRLAGQPQAYLARQMSNFTNGSRSNPVMTPIAKALTPSQIEAVSAYYAGQHPPAQKAAQASAASSGQLQRGKQLATVGDDKIAVQACANCHGPGGNGEAPTYPYLAGQHAGFLSASLGAWKDGSRKSDPSMQMNMIAKRLSDNDVAAVAAYYASQPVAPPATEYVNQASRAIAPAQKNAGSSAGSTPTRGVGTEQGAATAGGGQGPGGGGAASGAGPSGSRSGNAR